MGSILGGMIAVYLLSLLLEWAIFKRIADSAELGIPLSVAAAVVLAVILYGFGNADGGPWNPWPEAIAYVIGGFVIAPLRLRSYRKKLDSADHDADLRETFE